MAMDTHREALGSPSGRRAVAIALLVVAAIVAWVVVRDAGSDPVVKDVPAAQAQPAESANETGPQPDLEEPVAIAGPFTAEDLEGLVLQPTESEGLVKGLTYSTTYSGPADVGDIHHYTLVPNELLEDAGFVEAYSGMFMTDAFISTFASAGRDLATVAMLFESPEAAREALRIFADTRDEVWETWEPLPTRTGIGTIGRLGSDNVTVTYPSVGFIARAGNVLLLVGSQGGWEEDAPLPVPAVRGIAQDLLARARNAAGGA